MLHHLWSTVINTRRHGGGGRAAPAQGRVSGQGQAMALFLLYGS